MIGDVSLLQDTLRQTLEAAAKTLRTTYGIPRSFADDMERLAGEVDQPCVVAVVGRVKAGKSSFINALLGEDLAAVGTTETTATINYFRYGTPDPARPVRCHWRNGRYEDVDAAFLRGLQGNDLETLRRADGIEYLEYRLPSEFLRRVTLVDTPGTGAVVDSHQQRTADYLRLEGELRERHDRETRRLGETSDAVIYLIGAVARDSDRRFLEEFGQASQGGAARALNAMGVMAKIDLSPELMQRRHELAAKVSEKLKDQLNTVLPVSAGLCRALRALQAEDGARLRELVAALHRLSPARRDKLLSTEDFFLDLEDEQLPLIQRSRLRGDLDWGVFTAVAHIAVKTGGGIEAVDKVQAELAECCGFGPLREVLERHFFRRGELLRGHRVMNDALGLINRLHYQHLPTLRQRERDDEARRQRFQNFLNASRGGDPAVAAELSAFVQAHAVTYTGPVEAALRTVEKDLARVFHRLEAHNADFEALELLEKHEMAFSNAEKDELRALFGAYGMEMAKRLPVDCVADEDSLGTRQRQWRNLILRERVEARREVLTRAVDRLGLLLDELGEV